MYFGNIKTHDIADGPGVRVSLFVSGCTHHCDECFNPETWDFKYGDEFTQETEDQILTDLDHDYIKGLTLLGGEPFEDQNSKVLVPFVNRVRDRFPDKTIWCYSGYTFEEILESKSKDLLELLDVLVDGEFKIDLKVLNLRFRGSSNQRIIDVQSSLSSGKIVLWSDPEMVMRKEKVNG